METRLHILFEKYFKRTASPEEELELFTLLQKKEEEAALEILLEKAYLDYEQEARFFDAEQTSRMMNRVKQETAMKASAGRSRVWQYAAAILLSLCAGLFVYYYTTEPVNKMATKQKTVVKRDVAPGNEKASITLADGRTITMEEMANGLFNDQGNIFLKEQKGLLNYATNGAGAKDGAFHTMHVPKGGQYRLVLADGTKVWLNAASSLRYPTRFGDNIREVSITGEAYFEVAHDANKPFFVKCEGQRIQVLGTHFNVRAYPDEQLVRTTLLEGSVALTKEGVTDHITRLQPGEEASLFVGGDIRVNRLSDVTVRIGWTKGYFAFNRADLGTVLRELSRWYNVEFKVKASTTKTYTGKINRKLTLSELMNGLALSGIPIQIEDKEHIIELPK